jgi:hypothetical protein
MKGASESFHKDRFRLGLERVARVVDGVKDYDRILGPHRIDRPHYKSAAAAHAAGQHKEAFAITVVALRRARLTVYQLPSGCSTISFANTHNNKAELAFLAQKCAQLAPLEICEITQCQKIAGPRIAELPHADALFAVVAEFMSQRPRLSQALLHQLSNYVVAYCSFLHTLTSVCGFRPRGLVVANDHSPQQVALSMVAAELGIRRVYLQHAEVTEVFPPLDFEYSILRNGKSERVYRSIGPASGEVVVLSRRMELLDSEEIVRRASSVVAATKVEVGLYPSSVFNEERLREAATALRGNPEVSRVFLKPHPSSDLCALASTLGIECIGQTPTEPHVAVVGNSSVALELALAGHLVCQSFLLDSVGRDYYGFHNEGLTQEVAFGFLNEPFWNRVELSQDFHLAVVRRVAEEGGELDPQKQRSFLRRLMVDIGCVMYPGVSATDRLARYVSFFPASAIAMFRNYAGKLFDEVELVRSLDQLFHERRIDLQSCFRFIDFNGCASVVDFWFIAKHVEWNGQALDCSTGKALLEFSRCAGLSPKARSWMEAKLFELFLRARMDDLLVDLLGRAVHLSVADAAINRKIAFVRRLECSDADPRLAMFYDVHSDQLVGLDRLKMAVQCQLRDEGRLLYSDYRRVEEEFLRHANVQLAEEYRRLVLAPYESLRARCRYMDVKRDGTQAGQLVATICARLRQRLPYAVVRLSDGEGYLFRELNAYFFEEDARNRERHWWGEELDDRTRAKLTQAGLSAIRSADVLGIPSIYRFLRDHSVRSKTLLGGLQGRGLVSVLQGVGEVASPQAEFGDDKLNLAVFNRIEALRLMAEAASKVIVVNGAREDVLIDTFASLGPVEPITIPTHNKTLGNHRFVGASKPLPYLYESVCAKIEREVEPGVLVLIGGGIAGKAFIEAARRSGGVGLDLGSAMDELVGAGIHSLH